MIFAIRRIFFAVVNLHSPFDLKTIRKVLETAVMIIIVGCACWNIWVFGRNSLRLDPRNLEDVTEHTDAYAPIQQILIERGYRKGTVDMITNRSLTGAPSVFEDNGRWAHAQYVMVPWVLRREGNSAAGVPVEGGPAQFVIADFWDGKPEKLPEDLITLYEGPILALFERRAQ